MIEQIVNDELWMPPFVNVAAMNSWIGACRNRPVTLDTIELAAESFDRMLYRQTAYELAIESQTGILHCDDAAVQLHGYADGAGGT